MSARPIRLVLLGAAALGFAAPALAQQLPPPPAQPGVMDAAGRTMLHQQLARTSTDIAISALPKGVFLVRLTNTHGRLLGVERLVVVR